MPTEAELLRALRQADQAGDERAARLIADRIQATRQTIETDPRERVTREFETGFQERLRSYGTGARQIAGLPVSEQALAESQTERTGPGFAGQLGADLLVGGLVQAPTLPVTGPIMGSTLAAGAQAGLLPVDPEAGQSRAYNVLTGAGAGFVGGAVGRGISRLARPNVDTAAPSIREAATSAERGFGFRLTPGQRTSDPVLLSRERRWLTQENTVKQMTEIGRHNEIRMNRALGEEMGVDQPVDEITDAVVVRAKRLANAKFRVAKGPMILDEEFTDDLAKIGDARTLRKELAPKFADKVIAKRGRMLTLQGEDYVALRSELGRKMRTDESNYHLYRSVQRALDDAVDRSVRAGRAPQMVEQDLDTLKEGRRHWKAILTVEESRVGGAVDPNKLATKIDRAYSVESPSRMRELLRVLNTVPDMKARIGVSAARGQAVGPSVAVHPGGAQAFMHPGGLFDPMRAEFQTSPLGRFYYQPPGTTRRLVGYTLGGAANVAPRAIQLERTQE